MNPISTARSRRESRLRVEARLASLRSEPLVDEDVLAARLARYVGPPEEPVVWWGPIVSDQPIGRRILLTLRQAIV